MRGNKAFNEVGFKFDQWADAGYWQLVLNDVPANERIHQNNTR
jgi:L-amino acid N-acyltransferase YncA